MIYDVLDLTTVRKPRFAQTYTSANGSLLGALKAYVAAVKSRAYPSPEHCFSVERSVSANSIHVTTEHRSL